MPLNRAESQLSAATMMMAGHRVEPVETHHFIWEYGVIRSETAFLGGIAPLRVTCSACHHLSTSWLDYLSNDVYSPALMRHR